MAGEGLAEEPRADYSTIVSHFAPSPASSSSNNDEERRGASARGRGVEIRDSTKISSLWNKYLPTLLPFVLVDGRATFFALFVTYDEPLARAEDAKVVANQLYGIFPFFQDIQVMLVVGLGLLLTFLPRYGLSVLTHNFLLLNFSTQWALALQGLIHHFHHGQVHLDLRNLLTAEFAAVTVLISVGAVLGRTSPCQLLLVATCEVPVYLASEWAIVTHLGVLDVGGTITIHVFSCYFGLGVSKALFGATRRPVHPKETPTPRSDLLSLVGTLILWVFWPSFVAVLCQPGDAQHRAILNTLLAMSASTVTTTVASSLLERDGKLSPCHLQNGSLAGGVAIGAVADMAMGLGSTAAQVPPPSSHPTAAPWIPQSQQQPEKQPAQGVNPGMAKIPRVTQTAPPQGTSASCFALSRQHHPAVPILTLSSSSCSGLPCPQWAAPSEGCWLAACSSHSSHHGTRLGTPQLLPGRWKHSGRVS
uniref:Ammonium transporter AmtB-like domain-containing protein n=1 Tax=Bubo bubo TaxID=30461 RepID=A0A8C0FRW1_BUBBB